MSPENTVAVILAAGQGKRMQSQVQKQYLLLGEHPLLYYSLKAFEESVAVDSIVLVTGSEEIEYCRQEIVEKNRFCKVNHIVAGGKERYHSVYAGLQQITQADYVLIHDGARPFVTEEIIERTLAGAREYGACVAGMPSKDTVKLADEKEIGVETPMRSRVWTVQTPQTFSFPLIKEAYGQLIHMENQGQEVTVTDDAMALEQVKGRYAKLVEGSYENIKITTPSDLEIAENFLKKYY